jgi:hypothetical protein
MFHVWGTYRWFSLLVLNYLDVVLNACYGKEVAQWMLAGPASAVLFPIACLVFDLSRFVLFRSALYTSGVVVLRDYEDFPPCGIDLVDG